MSRPDARGTPGGAGLITALVTAALFVVLQVGAKTTRDTLFLATHPIDALPGVMLLAAVASLVIALIFSRVQKRLGPATLLPLVCVANTVLFALEWQLAIRRPEPAAVVVYLHVAALGPLTLSGFWSAVSERFDPHTAKRMVGRLAASGALGGLLGGIAAQQCIAAVPLPTMLLLLTCVSGVSILMTVMGGRSGTATTHTEPPANVRAAESQGRYMVDVALLVLATATIDSLLEYFLKSEAAALLDSAAELGSFFALFHAALSLVAFVCQAGLSRRALARLGVAGTIALMPGLALLGGTMAVAVPSLWAAVLLNGSFDVAQSSIFRSGYELLYTPVETALKRTVKPLIDVACYRLGDVVAAGVAMAALALLGDEANRGVVAISMAVAVGMLLLAVRIHWGYVAALAASLRSGALQVDQVAGLDATTQRTLTEATTTIDRQKLLAELERLKARRALHGDADLARVSRYVPLESDALEETLQRLETLLGASDADKKALLEELERQVKIEGWLIPLLVPLLGHRYLAGTALATLEKHGGGHEGTLLDSLLDEQERKTVRRRIPRVLRSIGSPRAREGLHEGLAAKEFVVRFHCVRALFLWAKERGEPVGDAEAVFAALAREAELPVSSWQAPPDEESLDGIVGKSAEGRRAPSRQDYAFMLLATVLDLESIELCHAALQSDDVMFRGTALEYLETVLPRKLHIALAERMGFAVAEARSSTARSAKTLLSELRRAGLGPGLGRLHGFDETSSD